MRVLGVDPSSSCTGIVKVDLQPSLPDPFQALIWKGIWKPPPKATRPAELDDFFTSLDEVIGEGQAPDIAVVLQLASMRGAKTVRTLSHFESIAYLALERRRVPIVTIKDGDARHAALGLPVVCSKREAIEAVVARYPALKWLPFGEKFDGPGGDQVDAFVGALSVSKAIRRGT